jgi:16S rRNA (cytidine1402-2'-O)-methyltransferase
MSKKTSKYPNQKHRHSLQNLVSCSKEGAVGTQNIAESGSVSVKSTPGIPSSWAPLWSEQMAETKGLFVVSTPIGHCEDITLRALETLGQVDGILCEDTRMTRTLLNHYGISKPCYSYHAHNEGEKVNGVLNRLKNGDRLALVSDRGTPLISDPGLLLVQKCHDENIPVHIMAGASSVMNAVVWCGLPCESFYFQGFMPTRKVLEHWAFLETIPAPIVFFVAPHDLSGFIREALKALGPRVACLMRELTKKFEERVNLPLDQMAQWVENAVHLGECVMVIDGKAPVRRVAKSKYIKDDPVVYEDQEDIPESLEDPICTKPRRQAHQNDQDHENAKNDRGNPVVYDDQEDGPKSPAHLLSGKNTPVDSE